MIGMRYLGDTDEALQIAGLGNEAVQMRRYR